MLLWRKHQVRSSELIDVSDYKPRKIPPPTWRECIKKVWEVDPLKCPHCTGEMKIISFINERPVIRKILEYLNLWIEEPKQRPPEEKLKSHDLFDDSWPGFEEPYITYD